MRYQKGNATGDETHGARTEPGSSVETVEETRVSAARPSCPECGGVIQFQSACELCPSCGFSRCG